MSLLNDVLRDLSRQQKVREAAQVGDLEFLQLTGKTSGLMRIWGGVLGVFLLLFLITLGVQFLWNGYTHSHIHTQIQRANAQGPVAALAPELKSSSPKIQPTQSAPLQSVTSHSGATASVPDAEVQVLLQKAERAMALDRLTAPVEDSAYTYYQKILVSHPRQPEALDGMSQIAARYLIKAEEQMKLGSVAQADAYVQRATFVSPGYVSKHPLTKPDAAPGELSTMVADSNSSPNPNPERESIKPFEVTEAPHASVTPNPGWQDEYLAQRAQTLIAQGKLDEAQAMLKDFIAQEKTPAKSAALLAETYLQQGNQGGGHRVA